MRRLAMTALLALFSVWLAPAVLAAPETVAQKEVRTRFQALEKASNARNLASMKTFIDRSFTMKLPDGQTLKYDDAMKYSARAFKQGPKFRATSQIQKIDVNGNTATLAYKSTISATDAQGQNQQVTLQVRDRWKKINGKWMMVYQEVMPLSQ